MTPVQMTSHEAAGEGMRSSDRALPEFDPLDGTAAP
jgi:hypothetical protein